MADHDPAVRTQYRDDRNLNARIRLHDRFSTNPYGWQRWIFDRVLESAPAAARVLEIGCGPAGLWTANPGRIPLQWDIVLTDFSIGMIRSASDQLTSIEHDFALLAADAQALPFADGIFNAVIANHMLYHVPNRRRALTEMRRVMAPGGRLYASTVGEGHMRDVWALVAPFVPDIHDRVGRVSRAFTLENGDGQVADVFGDVERNIYEDDLAVTEAEPVIDYLRSSTALMGCNLETSGFAAIRQAIASRIAAEGCFYIQKSSGLFIARKP